MKRTSLPIKLLMLLGSLTIKTCCGGDDTRVIDNLAPTISSSDFQVQQDSELTVNSDAEADSITFSRTGEPDSDVLVAFTTEGEFTYRPMFSLVAAIALQLGSLMALKRYLQA